MAWLEDTESGWVLRARGQEMASGTLLACLAAARLLVPEEVTCKPCQAFLEPAMGQGVWRCPRCGRTFCGGTMLDGS